MRTVKKGEQGEERRKQKVLEMTKKLVKHFWFLKVFSFFRTSFSVW